MPFLSTFVSYYLHVKNRILAKITAEIDEEEIDGVSGATKKAEVITQLQKLIPAVIKPFITVKVLDALVQIAFERIESYAKKQVEKQQSEKKSK